MDTGTRCLRPCSRLPPVPPAAGDALAPIPVETTAVRTGQRLEHGVGAGDQAQIGPEEPADQSRIRMGLDRYRIVGHRPAVPEVGFELVTDHHHEVCFGERLPEGRV